MTKLDVSIYFSMIFYILLLQRGTLFQFDHFLCVHVAQFIYGPYGSLYSILKNPLKYKLEFICQDPLKSIVSFTETTEWSFVLTPSRIYLTV